MSYQRHGNSKGARQAHHRREQSRRRKLREKGGQVEPFGYADTRGRDRKGLRIMSVTKGARDGAPSLASVDTRPKGGDGTEIAAPFTSGAIGAAETPDPGSPHPKGTDQ